ncbi:hypothetical protein RWE15_06325 [Virgibacillus halophilus]|uniref:Uncharacterized protein n=1 Tax=Tigheibacillus halophilus TaxID=361280 RepID=A0ABU5C4Q0_9BACI|nr:hypothetical protein [Virgibacillus halophilus]
MRTISATKVRKPFQLEKPCAPAIALDTVTIYHIPSTRLTSNATRLSIICPGSKDTSAEENNAAPNTPNASGQ